MQCINFKDQENSDSSDSSQKLASNKQTRISMKDGDN